MKVLHVIPSVAPRYGGPSSAIVPMCQALTDLGLRPLILTTDADGPGRLPVPLGTPTMWQGVPAMFFKKDFSESFKYSHTLAAWLRAHVRDFQVVHIHAVLSHAPLAAGAACRRAGIPYVVRPLGTIAPWSLARNSWRKRALFSLGARRMLAGAAAIHYTADEERQSVERTLGLSHGVVIPLGVDQEYLTQPIVTAAERGRDPYVLVLARLHPKKNLEALIEAFIAATGNGAGRWRLVLAGSGDAAYVRSLERLVAERNAADRITFPGWVDGRGKLDLLRRASLFAIPSLHENFGVALIEALAAGVPALVSDQVDLADAVQAAHAGWIVATDPQSVRAGLVEALSHSEEFAWRGAAARNLAASYAWPGVGAQLVNLYRGLAAAPGPASDLHQKPAGLDQSAPLKSSSAARSRG